MIVDQQLDRSRGRVGRVDLFEKVDELARAMSFFDAGVNDAGHQIEAGQQAHGSPADVFLIARESLMNLRLGRQVGRRGRERLYARLLVTRNNRDRGSVPLLRPHSHFQRLDLAINLQHFRHFLGELGVTVLEVVFHLAA